MPLSQRWCDFVDWSWGSASDWRPILHKPLPWLQSTIPTFLIGAGIASCWWVLMSVNHFGLRMAMKVCVVQIHWHEPVPWLHLQFWPCSIKMCMGMVGHGQPASQSASCISELEEADTDLKVYLKCTSKCILLLYCVGPEPLWLAAWIDWYWGRPLVVSSDSRTFQHLVHGHKAMMVRAKMQHSLLESLAASPQVENGGWLVSWV